MNLFDLEKNDIAAKNEAGFEFELVLPNGEKTGALIKVRGESSPTVRQHGKRVYNEMQMKETAAKRRGKEYQIDLDEAEEINVSDAVNRVISWKNISEGAKEVPFTIENATRIFTKHIWIREQVLEESRQVLNYFR